MCGHGYEELVLAAKDDKIEDESKPVEPVKKKAKAEDKPETKTKAKAEMKDEAPEKKPAKAEVSAAPKGDDELPEGTMAMAPVSSRDMRSLLIKVAAIVVAVLAVVIIVFGVLVYGYKSDNTAVNAVAS
ncbi:MAG TPA: hypothetical protein VHQ86_05675, partial [Candidatus Saccharimonadia bacterium]|nr:hypothetical protein [Candidatus Saccharimonadia bacterium]